MDMDSSHPNWLVFSLSNHSLFQPSFSSPALPDRDDGRSAASAAAPPTNPTHLSALGPKLEDFLGGSSTAHTVPQFVTMPDMEIYHDDSELKTIAASFLRGFSSQQTDKQVTVAPPAKKTAETFGQRTSIFRGVTRHRWTGRYEAHLWDNSCRREGQSRKGRQVYLGGYDKEEKAARAYDLAALKYWGPTTTTNFPVSDYERELEEMKHMTRQEFVASLRRRSSGFSRGASIYRGVTRHHQHGRWQARIGRVAGNKDLYLGTFSTQEEAAEAYDIAAIKFRGLNAVTNFDMSRYDVRSIASSNLPVGGANNKPKTTSTSDLDKPKELSIQNSTATINFSLPMKQDQDEDQSSNLWAALGYQNSRNTDQGTSLFQESSNINGTALSYSSVEAQVQQPNYEHEVFYNNYQQQGSGGDEAAAAAGMAVSNNGNWIQPALIHTTAKSSSLSSFQTPIFGVE